MINGQSETGGGAGASSLGAFGAFTLGTGGGAIRGGGGIFGMGGGAAPGILGMGGGANLPAPAAGACPASSADASFEREMICV
jgi:hypothetical protein